jgi:hypothetical protein
MAWWENLMWSIHITPGENELLTSFLMRACHGLGLTAHRLGAIHFPGVALWNRDLDRSAGDSLLSAIGHTAGVSWKRVVAMTLRSIEGFLGRDDRPPGRCVVPWLLPLGIYHRIRRLHGLRYCPACLAASPCFQRSWRLSFVTMCPIHRCSLADQCPACQSVIMPHRQSISLVHCWQCGSRLDIVAPVSAASASDLPHRQWLQQYGLGWLEGHQRRVGKHRVGAVDGLRGMEALRCIFQLRQVPVVNHSTPDIRVASESDTFRASRYEATRLTALLQDWPQAAITLAKAERLTKRVVVRYEPLPSWLRDLTEVLPPGRIQARPRQRFVLRRLLRRLHRQRSADWRTKRARLLLAAARRRS